MVVSVGISGTSTAATPSVCRQRARTRRGIFGSLATCGACSRPSRRALADAPLCRSSRKQWPWSDGFIARAEAVSGPTTLFTDRGSFFHAHAGPECSWQNEITVWAFDEPARGRASELQRPDLRYRGRSRDQGHHGVLYGWNEARSEHHVGPSRHPSSGKRRRPRGVRTLASVR